VIKLTADWPAPIRPRTLRRQISSACEHRCVRRVRPPRAPKCRRDGMSRRQPVPQPAWSTTPTWSRSPFPDRR